MAEIVLVGAFGQRNPGDDALGAAFCRALAAHDVRVASAHPVETAERFGVESFPATPWATARAVAGADAVVVGGGTVFKLLHRSSRRWRWGLLARTALLVAGAHARRVPVAMIGVGAGELHGAVAGRAASWIARHVDLLVLRDEESAAVLSGAGVDSPFWIGADPAWNDVPARAGRADDIPRAGEPDGDRPRRLLVSLSHLAAGRDGVGPLARRLAEAVETLGDAWEVHLQPWQTEVRADDRALARAIQEAAPDAIIVEPPRDLADAQEAAAAADVVLGLRFHSLVAAGAAGTRFVAVAHEPKLAALARRLDQLAVPTYASSAVVAAAVDSALEAAPPPVEAVEGERRAAAVAFELLDLMLNDGELAEPATLPGLGLSAGRGAW